jgi:uncharacterized protein (TIGR03000 family)
MYCRNEKKWGAFVGVVLIVNFLATRACAQVTGSANAASASPGMNAAVATLANSAPQTVHYHYHFHQHNYPSTASLMYPNYANPYTTGTLNSSYPLPPTAFTPTQAQPYAPGYIPGPFAPLGFQNLATGAPPAQGVIHIFLPTSDALVYINGQQLRAKKGKDRKFTTPVLPSNREFQYWVTATFSQDGESSTQYRKAIVGAGEYNVVDFTRPPEANPIQLPAGPVDPNSVVPPVPE